MRIQLAPRAQQRARIIKTWWWKHRPGMEHVFEQEFAYVTSKLTAISPLSPLGTAQGSHRGKTLWQILLPKSEQHLLYTIDEAKDLIVVRTLWGARRGRRPKL